MRNAFLLIIFVNLLAARFYGQADSTQMPAKLADGVYLSYADFRFNRAVNKDDLRSTLPKDHLDYISKVLDAEMFSYSSGAEVVTLPTEKVWGYVQNNTLYLNYKSEFYRVPVFGTISYFVAKVMMVTPGYYDPRFGYPVGNTRTQEVREFLFDYYSGQIREFSMDLAEDLLKRDAKLYEEYAQLGRRKQKEQVYRYIRRFNELHPVYFLR